MKLGMQVGLRPRHIVLDGNPSPPPNGHNPQFLAHICSGQMAGWIKMLLGVEVGLGPGDFVLDGDPAPTTQKEGRVPQFSAHVYCGQMAGCIKMPVGTEVGFSSGDFVLDGNPAPPRKKDSPHPIFGPFLLRPNSWMDEDATWYGSRPRPKPHCVRRDPAPTAKGAQQPPSDRFKLSRHVDSSNLVTDWFAAGHRPAATC